MDSIFSIEQLTVFITLTLMEVVLGIDNIILVTLLVTKLPPGKARNQARQLGISLALLTRLALLFSISWVMQLTQPLFVLAHKTFSARDLILLVGGLFLIAKATSEIHNKLESAHIPSAESDSFIQKKTSTFNLVILQIMFLDIIFSLDSVITAVGMAQQLTTMVLAMITSVLIMLGAAKAIGHFIERHPTVKILALAFLLLIGMMLFIEGTGTKINKAYIYFAMFFSLSVEALNINYRKKSTPHSK
jgi:predicted tellurium resistance membrane protein TerC